jgi:hypothetical protein
MPLDVFCKEQIQLALRSRTDPGFK